MIQAVNLLAIISGLLALGTGFLIASAWTQYGLTYIGPAILLCWMTAMSLLAWMNSPSEPAVAALAFLLALCCAVMLFLKGRDFVQAHWQQFGGTKEHPLR